MEQPAFRKDAIRDRSFGVWSVIMGEQMRLSSPVRPHSDSEEHDPGRLGLGLGLDLGLT